MRVLMMILRLICYLALAVMLFACVAMAAPFLLDLCRNASGGTVTCTDPTYRSLFETGFTIVMMGIFTGLPGILAVGGVIFSVIDIRRWLAR